MLQRGRKSRAQLAVIGFDPDNIRPHPPADEAASPPPPDHLGEPERQIWRDVFSDFKLETRAAHHILVSALEAHQRARECREAIKAKGMTVGGKDGQLMRPHPLLAVERDARQAWLAGIRALGLEL
jgi:P27 family predicted phage terminase small subunit